MTILSRRDWLRTSAKALGGGVGLSWVHDAIAMDFRGKTSHLPRDSRFFQNAGEYGVASGEPQTDGFTIWTRLPDMIVSRILRSAGKQNSVTLKYWIAQFQDHETPPLIIFRGETPCCQGRDFTARATVTGLEASKRYLYGFELDDLWGSETGLARTLPATDDNPESLCFAYMSCQLYGTGFYTVYEALSQDDSVDYCIHLGDSIYESVGEYYRILHVREDPVGTAYTLEDYRSIHKKCLGDPWYREARRRFTWICIPDDHEVANNYIGSQSDTYERQHAGITAYWDFMPLPALPSTGDPGSIKPPQIPFRSFQFGSLATLYALNERQHRNMPHQAESTMLGADQRAWLYEDLSSLEHSSSSLFPRWQVLLSEVMMMPFRPPLRSEKAPQSPLEGILPKQIFAPTDVQSQSDISPAYIDGDDSWDGYKEERDQILEGALLAQREQSRLLVWTGDVHNLYAGELLHSTGQRGAIEVTTGSVSSPGVGDIFLFGTHRIVESIVMAQNPHLKAINLKEHMYIRCTLNRNQAQYQSVCPATIRNWTSTASVKDTLVVNHSSLEISRIG